MKKCEKTTQEIGRLVEETYQEAKNIMLLVGREIVLDKDRSLPAIFSHITWYDSRKLETGLRSFLDWVDTEGRMRMTSQHGLLNPPIQISPYERIYILEAPKKPWELIICPPAVGIPSGKWITPLGMGIGDDQNQPIGILTWGVSVRGMNQRIAQVLLNSSIEFLITDREMNVIFQSISTENYASHSLIRRLFADFDCLKVPNRELLSPTEDGGLSFFYYESFKNTPYCLFVGLDQKLFRSEFYFVLIPRLVEIMFSAMFCLLILFVFWKRQVCPLVQLSCIASGVLDEQIAEEIPDQGSYELQKIADSLKKISSLVRERQDTLGSLDTAHQQLETVFKQLELKSLELAECKQRLDQITHLCHESELFYDRFIYELKRKLKKLFQETGSLANVLLRNMTGSLDFSLSEEYEIEIIQRVVQNLHFFASLTPEVISLSQVHVQAIIDQSIKILSAKAFLKNIQILTDLQASPLLVHLDEIHFKQVILSLIARAFENVQNGGVIQISAYQKEVHRRPVLELILKDDGFGLSQEDIDRLENKFSTNEMNLFDLKNLSLQNLHKIIELHQGTIQFSSKWQKGTCVVVCIPCDLEVQLPAPVETVRDLS